MKLVLSGEDVMRIVERELYAQKKVKLESGNKIVSVIEHEFGHSEDQLVFAGYEIELEE